MKTIYATDLDGTLLGSNAALSDYTTRALRQFASDGIPVTFITARTPATVEPIMSAAPPIVPGVVMTGAALWDSAGRRYERVTYHTPGDVEVIEEICRRHGVNPFVYTLRRESPDGTARGRASSCTPDWTARGRASSCTPDGTARGRASSCTSDGTARGRASSCTPDGTARGRASSCTPDGRREGAPPPGHPCNGLVVYHEAAELTAIEHEFVVSRTLNDLKSFELHTPAPADTRDCTVLFFAMGEPRRLQAAAEEIAAVTGCSASCYPDTYHKGLMLLEIFTRGVSKAGGIDELRRVTGADRVVAFGDNLNDIPMLRRADVAVAVENAHPDVKAIADIVIGPCDSDAVVKFIAAENQI